MFHRVCLAFLAALVSTSFGRWLASAGLARAEAVEGLPPLGPFTCDPWALAWTPRVSEASGWQRVTVRATA